ncbi:recombinase XerD [Candidatus Endobugula sertula]|uniref:Recombinase XerD n=1 Tax=Candidatus Endobugula sertula TaxID=62101 RepID=A0A1D2QLH5_9GAMM|nr:recombinase XerD [Candidatus Endobugula sertula]
MSRGKRGTTTELPVIGNPNDPHSLYHWMHRFLQYQAERHYSQRTIQNRENYLRYFIQWCDERGLNRPNEVTKPILESYQRYLYHYRKKNGEPLSVMSQNGRMIPIRALFKWLARNNHLLYNPASDLELPRAEKRLPQAVLTQDEAETILSLPDTSTSLGIRDRAILETFYSTGMRRLELTTLKWSAIDYERGTIFISQGKGHKDRMVPIGDRALKWIYSYQYQARSELTLGRDDGTLFVTKLGDAFHANAMSKLVREYVQQADIGKKGSCHLFRHTCATLMLEGGADVRYIQALLGHAKLETTEIYTQVSIKQLKDVHTMSHPAKITKTGSMNHDEV